MQADWEYVICPVLGGNHKKEWNCMTRTKSDGSWKGNIGTFRSVRAAREAIAHLKRKAVKVSA